MKRLVFLFIITLFMACSTDNNCYGVDCLPEATQTGENTFGCLVDEQAFIARPSNNPAQPGLFAEYRREYYDGVYKYRLFLLASDVVYGTQILIDGIVDEPLTENNSYSLSSHQLLAYYAANDGSNYDYDSEQFGGSLRITKLDEENQIISGTIEFRIVNQSGDIIEITEGRFDINYAD